MQTLPPELVYFFVLPRLVEIWIQEMEYLKLCKLVLLNPTVRDLVLKTFGWTNYWMSWELEKLPRLLLNLNKIKTNKICSLEMEDGWYSEMEPLFPNQNELKMLLPRFFDARQEFRVILTEANVDILNNSEFYMLMELFDRNKLGIELHYGNQYKQAVPLIENRYVPTFRGEFYIYEPIDALFYRCVETVVWIDAPEEDVFDTMPGAIQLY